MKNALFQFLETEHFLRRRADTNPILTGGGIRAEVRVKVRAVKSLRKEIFKTNQTICDIHKMESKKITAIYPSFKGKANDTKAKQLFAAKRWHVYYWHEGKEFKVSNGLNKIKDFETKIEAFEELRGEVENMLMSGWKPNEDNTEYFNRIKGQNLNAAIKMYIDEVRESKEYREDNKTDKDYASRLKLLREIYVPDWIINKHTKEDYPLYDIKGYEIIKAIEKKNKNGKWANSTANGIYTAISGFFKWCVINKHLTEHPFSNESYKPKKEHPSDKHEPLLEHEMKDFINFLKSDVKYRRELLMIQIIYYTCLRPIEIKRLKVYNYDMDRGVIILEYNKTKSEENGVLSMPQQLVDILNDLDIKNKPKNSYLFSSGRNNDMFGPNNVGRDVIERKINKMLHDAGYANASCYATKHFANIQRKIKDGWEDVDIMIGNRHANLEETNTYMRTINKYIDRTRQKGVSTL